MRVELKNNTLKISYKLKSSETYKIQKSKKVYAISIFKKPMILKGMSSATEDNHDVLFIDYDTQDLGVIKRDYSVIQRRFKLPQAYLFKTNRGYHVVCLKKFLPHTIYTILSYTHCDSAYNSMPLRNRYRGWVLRISQKQKKKPIFDSLIGKDFRVDTGKISKPHKEFLSKLYPGIKHPKYKNLDKCKNIFLQEYEGL